MSSNHIIVLDDIPKAKKVDTPAVRDLKAFLPARQSENSNEHEMTLDEINEEIRIARAERKARLKE